MDVNFNKYSNVSFLTFVCTVFISSKNHIQVLNRSSKAGAASVKTTASINVINDSNYSLVASECCLISYFEARKFWCQFRSWDLKN